MIDVNDTRAVFEYLERRIEELKIQVEAQREIPFVKRYAAPTKVVEGMVAWADGTTWNPGSGAGIYHYRGGVWRYLG